MKSLLLGLVATITAFASISSATPADTICRAKAGRITFELLFSRYAIEPSYMDYREFSVNGVAVARFPELAFHRSFKNVGTKKSPFMNTSETAQVGNNKIEVVYPEQDPESDTLNIFVDISVPEKSFKLSRLEMDCINE
jgi:hypothetical protein